ncbi:basic salivary proline-rich protein 3-like [Caloenas nicobarica]|uniref:basic salivary proline-rich protein 3-like n=1 Tax=Caloenas nicobarica TaxID=187106 RepID=UPI0032B70237
MGDLHQRSIENTKEKAEVNCTMHHIVHTRAPSACGEDQLRLAAPAATARGGGSGAGSSRHGRAAGPRRCGTQSQRARTAAASPGKGSRAGGRGFPPPAPRHPLPPEPPAGARRPAETERELPRGRAAPPPPPGAASLPPQGSSSPAGPAPRSPPRGGRSADVPVARPGGGQAPRRGRRRGVLRGGGGTAPAALPSGRVGGHSRRPAQKSGHRCQRPLPHRGPLQLPPVPGEARAVPAAAARTPPQPLQRPARGRGLFKALSDGSAT